MNQIEIDTHLSLFASDVCVCVCGCWWWVWFRSKYKDMWLVHQLLLPMMMVVVCELVVRAAVGWKVLQADINPSSRKSFVWHEIFISSPHHSLERLGVDVVRCWWVLRGETNRAKLVKLTLIDCGQRMCVCVCLRVIIGRWFMRATNFRTL